MAAPLSFSDSLRARWARLSPRERFLIGACVVTVVLVLFLLWMRGGGEGSAEDTGVELAAAPPVAAPIVAATPVTPQPPIADVSALVLHGILARSAIIGSADGVQRTIPIGREFMPGVTLKSTGFDHVVLATPGGDMRLALKQFGGPAPVAAAAPMPGPTASRGGDAVLGYRLGLEPRRVGGRISGFTLQPGASVPSLTRAGLRPGDVLIAVNGQEIASEEDVMEMPAEIAGSYDAQFTFERDGRRQTVKLPVNPKS